MPQTSSNPQSPFDSIMDYIVATLKDIKTTNRPPGADPSHPTYGNNINKVYRRPPNEEFDKEDAPVLYVELKIHSEKAIPSSQVEYEGLIEVSLGVFGDDDSPAQIDLLPSLLSDLYYDVRRALVTDRTWGRRVDHSFVTDVVYDQGIAIEPRRMAFMELAFKMTRNSDFIERVTH